MPFKSLCVQGSDRTSLGNFANRAAAFGQSSSSTPVVPTNTTFQGFEQPSSTNFQSFVKSQSLRSPRSVTQTRTLATDFSPALTTPSRSVAFTEAASQGSLASLQASQMSSNLAQESALTLTPSRTAPNLDSESAVPPAPPRKAATERWKSTVHAHTEI